jgi:hypothetical protein
VKLSVSAAGGCEVLLRWADHSTSEGGFRVYRSRAGGAFRPVATLAANSRFAELTHRDRVSMGGHYGYYVAAVNGAGEAPGPIAGVDVPSPGCSLRAPVTAGRAASLLQFEALSLVTTKSFARVHCYATLAGLTPDRRIPEDDAAFLMPEGPGWNIAAHAARIHRLIFAQRSGEPVPVKINCRGTGRHGESYDLGTWAKNHGPEDWQGHDLNGVAQGFHVTYRLQPYENLPALQETVLDTSIPPPSRVQLATDDQYARAACESRANRPEGNEAFSGEAMVTLWACLEINERMLIWDWSPQNSPYTQGDITGFRVDINRSVRRTHPVGGLEANPFLWDLLGETGSVSQAFPVQRPGECRPPIAYRVRGFIRDGSGYRVSPNSNTYLASSDCPLERRRALVEVTLEQLSVENSKDVDGVEWLCPFDACDDTTQESYGVFRVGAFLLAGSGDQAVDITAFVFGGDLCVGFFDDGFFLDNEVHYGVSICPGSDTVGISNGGIDLGTRQMRRCESTDEGHVINVGDCTPRGMGKNVTQLLVPNHGFIKVQPVLKDKDGTTGDDIWCTATLFTGSRTVERWATADSRETVRNRSQDGRDSLRNWDADQDADCELTVRIRGLGEVILP